MLVKSGIIKHVNLYKVLTKICSPLLVLLGRTGLLWSGKVQSSVDRGKIIFFFYAHETQIWKNVIITIIWFVYNANVGKTENQNLVNW